MDEDLIERLRDMAPRTATSLPLPDQDDLIDAEEALLIRIPRPFREFLLKASDIELGRIEPCTCSDSGLHTYLPEVTSQAWADGMPRELLAVSRADEGCYAIDQEGQVSLWSFSEETVIEEWQTLEEWIEQVWMES